MILPNHSDSEEALLKKILIVLGGGNTTHTSQQVLITRINLLIRAIPDPVGDDPIDEDAVEVALADVIRSYEFNLDRLFL
jgi:hypothetical protein